MSGQDTIRVGGLTPFSTVDCPGHLSAVVFCQGCPWRCRYCHNQHLLPAGMQPTSSQRWGDVLGWLEQRRGLLEFVVFSGGEPLLQRHLPTAMREVQTLGYRVGLHTAGIYPARLQAVLPLLDWVGFDVKAAFDRYARVTAVPHSGQQAQQALEFVLASGVPHEVRCTVDETLLSPDDMQRMVQQLSALGVRQLVLQAVRHEADQRQSVPAAFLQAATGLPQVWAR